MLVIDEAQERGGTPWEDRILNHIIDRRYAAMIPTIIIANAKPDALVASLGESIADRMRETGGIIEITGTSHRGRP
jgi:DNA replication protein DnaC